MNDIDITPQPKTTRSCVLKSKKTNKEYSFRSFKDADIFLGRQRGYSSGKARIGKQATRLLNDGTKEYFDIFPGEQLKVFVTVASQPEQLCWKCQNCYSGCNWSRNYKPVEGWTATESIKDNIKTYCVTDCPEFKSDKRIKENGSVWMWMKIEE